MKKRPFRDEKEANEKPLTHNRQGFQKLLGSSIYITSTFYRFVLMGVYLVHWTHSFLYLHNTSSLLTFQDGMFHKNERKKLEKVSMDKGMLNVI